MTSGSGTVAGAPIVPRFAISSGDAWGGLAAMLVALPSSIAFGVVIFSAASPSLSSAGALAGVIGAAVLGIVAPLVGRNGGFITAPCAPAAAVLSGLAAHLALGGAADPGKMAVVLALTALVSALLQVAYGALRFGRMIKFIPYQVVTGYLSGVAVIIAAAQIPRLVGLPGTKLAEAMINPERWSVPAVVVGVATIGSMVIARRFTRRLPEAIVGLAAGTAAYFAAAAFLPQLRTALSNPLVIGPIPSAGSFFGAVAGRIASIGSLTMADVALVFGPALTLSVLLSIDTLKTCVVLDALLRSRHDSNRELVAQGVANLAAFFAGGVPGAGTMGPTLVNVTSGGRTLWSGVFSGVLIAVVFLALGSLIAWVPIAALAGVLVVVAWRMFDFGAFQLLRVPSTRLDFVVIAAVIAVAATVGLIEAALVGVSLAILLFMRNQIRGSVVLRRADVRQIRSKRRRTDEEVELLDRDGAAALVVHLRGDLFFGTTDQLFQDLERDLAERRFILLDFRRVESMDYTAMHLFGQMRERLHDRGGELLFSGMPTSLPTHRDIEAYLDKLHGAERRTVFDTLDGALEWMEERILEQAGWVPAGSRPPLELEEIALCRELDEEAVRELRGCVEERSFDAGQTIFGVGDTDDDVYFVRSGRVHILLPLGGGQKHHLATICRGEFFGEMAFLDHAVRSAEAAAATGTRLFALSRDRFDALAIRNEAIASRIFEQFAVAIAHRLRPADSELQALEER